VASRARLIALALSLLALAPAAARAQAPADQATEERPTGLPGGVDWTFNFDASWGTFGFANSLFQDPKEGTPTNLTDQWFEGAIKPSLSGSRTFAANGELYGRASAVGERTYGAQPTILGGDASSFHVEDLSLGWRSGASLGSTENLLDVTVGKTQYTLGHGLLLWDGAAEGGSRGGYWTNARKAFQFAAIGRAHAGPHHADVAYLDKDELLESDSGTRLWLANYEYAIGETSTFGVTYMKFFANTAVAPDRDGMNVFNVRAFTAPLVAVSDLSFEFEYVSERNGDFLSSNAWTLGAAYELSDVAWKPTLSYRYALFQGDDPATPRNENFDHLLTGFYDWGYWWQGEIIGEYVAVNSNRISNLARVHLTPTERIGGGLMFFTFNLDQPGALGRRVTSSDLAGEFDGYVDWKANQNVTVSLVGAFANPGTAAEQAFNRTKSFTYGMVFVAYAY